MMRFLLWLTAGLLALAVWAGHVNPLPADEPAVETAEDRAPVPAMVDPHVLLVIGQDAIKHTLREPGSVEWVTVFVTDDAPAAVCAKFRARNGFGGYASGQAVHVGGMTLHDAQSWNVFCASKTIAVRV